MREGDPSVSVAVVERGALPEGASTRNAGFACFGSLTELLDDLETQSESDVFALVERRFRGLARLRERCGDVHLQYEPFGGYEIFKDVDPSAFEKCVDSLAYFNKMTRGITGLAETYRLSTTDFGFQNVLPTMIFNAAEGQIHTGKMMTRLLDLACAQDIRFFNGLKINQLVDNFPQSEKFATSFSEGIRENTEGSSVELITDEGWSFRARKVIVATNGFARQLMPTLEVTAARNQVWMTEPIPNLKIKGCFHYDKGYYYFRNVGNRLLVGGGRHLAFAEEKTDAFGATETIQDALNQLVTSVILPNKMFEISDSWSGILGIGQQKKPIIQHVSPNVVVAVRMGGMGVAIGSLVGEEAAALVSN